MSTRCLQLRRGLSVVISEPMVQALCTRACAAAARLPHGGVEIGEVLWGIVDEDRVSVEASIPVTIEYAHGPVFRLSERDREELRRLLAAPESRDTSVAGLTPLGLFVSHSRHGLEATEEEVGLCDEFFQEAWQFLFLLKPQALHPAEGLVLGRNEDGAQDPACGARFSVEMAPRGGGRSMPSAARAMSPDQLYWAKLAAEYARPATGGSGRSVAPAVIFFALLALLTAAGWALFQNRERPAPVLGLGATAFGPVVAVHWRTDSPLLGEAREARLRVLHSDGGVTEQTLSRRDLAEGVHAQVAGAQAVSVSMRVVDRNGRAAEEAAAVVRQPLPQPAAAAAVPAPAPPAGAPDAAERAAKVQQPKPTVRPAPAREPPLRVAEVKRAYERNFQPLQRVRLPGAAARPIPEPPNVAAVVQVPVPAPNLPDAIPAPAPGPAVAVAPNPTPEQRQPMRPPVPPRGRLIWTGRLDKGETLVIDGDRASKGFLSGRLPQRPVRVTASPAALVDGGMVVYSPAPARTASTEAPGPQNGWNTVMRKYDARRSGDVLVVERPSAGNSWRRLAVRASGGGAAVILIDWEGLPEP